MSAALIPGMPEMRVGDIRGWLAFTDLLPTALQNAEDSTLDADHRSHTHPLRIRPATETERMLLRHIGFDLTDHPNLSTHVSYNSRTLRRREWPELANADSAAPEVATVQTRIDLSSIRPNTTRSAQ